jgi:hypothetical protein
VVLEFREWTVLINRVTDLLQTVRKSKSQNVSVTYVGDIALDIAEIYFREFRPDLLRIGFPVAELSGLDQCFTSLNRLARGRSRRSSQPRFHFGKLFWMSPRITDTPIAGRPLNCERCCVKWLIIWPRRTLLLNPLGSSWKRDKRSQL